MNYKRILLLITIICCSNYCISKTLDVGITPVEPFAFNNANGEWTGISVDLWKSIADKNNIKYRFVELSLTDNIDLVQSNQIDIGIGAISVTSDREQRIDFSHGYFKSGLNIISKAQSGFFTLDTLKDLSIAILGLLVFINIGALCISGIEVYLTKQPNQQFKLYINCCWWSVVTITTTGYGDYVPTSTFGKTFATLWMIIGAIVFPTYISVISVKTLAINDQALISNITELHKYQIGVVHDTTGENYLIRNNIPYSVFDNLSQMIKAIKSKDIDGGVYDSPMLQAIVRLDSELLISNKTLTTEFYALMLPVNSQLKDTINLTIPSIISTDFWNNTLQKYLD